MSDFVVPSGYNPDEVRRAFAKLKILVSGFDDPSLYALLAGATFVGPVAGLTPTIDAHFATKGYVDGLVLDFHDPVTVDDTASVKLTLTGQHLTADVLRGVTTKTADYTALVADYNIVADGSSNTVTITLMAAPVSGQVLNLACLDSTFAVTIDFNGKLFYDSASDETLFKGENLTVQYTGTVWVGC